MSENEVKDGQSKKVAADFETYKPSGNGGIKSFRRATAKRPAHHCSNCKCDRYSPCNCPKK